MRGYKNIYFKEWYMYKVVFSLMSFGLLFFVCNNDDTLILQPGAVPGRWDLRQEKYPDLAQIQAKPPTQRPGYGLYTRCKEYREHRESIKKVGWQVLGVAGPMDDTTFTLLLTDSMEVMMTVGQWVLGENITRVTFKNDDEFLNAYLSGVHTFLTRYGPRGTFFKDHPTLPVYPIKEVEIWHEPNFNTLIVHKDSLAKDATQQEVLYSKMLPAVYALIQKKWPDVLVVGFATGGVGAADVPFIKAVHAAMENPQACYDVLSTHPYSTPCPPEVFVKQPNEPSKGYAGIENFTRIKNIMQAYGCGDKPIYYSEVGWPVTYKNGGHFATPSDTRKICVIPGLQAAYVVRQYIQGMRLGVDKTMVMAVTDRPGFNGGFFLKDTSWRPSAAAVQNLIRLMPHPQLRRIISEGNDGYFAYGFMPDIQNSRLKEVIIAWNIAGNRDVKIPVQGRGHRMVDMVGNAMRLRSMGGTVGITIGPYPVYITAK